MFKQYAHSFASYLLANLKDISNINKIILFGSAAKDEAIKHSDIDIFIDVKKENKTFSKEVKKMLEEFYKSREALYFKSKGIDNRIDLIIGKLDEWKELKKSIESTGIILYGKYLPTKVEGKKYAIIFWDSIEKNRGAFLNKMYGFKVKNKLYKGLIEKLKGKKCGKSSMMIPIEEREKIINILRHYKVNAKIIDVYA